MINTINSAPPTSTPSSNPIPTDPTSSTPLNNANEEIIEKKSDLSPKKPKSPIGKKKNLKYWLGGLALLLMLIGGGVGLYLSKVDQDVRQQASVDTATVACPAGDKEYENAVACDNNCADDEGGACRTGTGKKRCCNKPDVSLRDPCNTGDKEYENAVACDNNCAQEVVNGVCRNLESKLRCCRSAVTATLEPCPDGMGRHSPATSECVPNPTLEPCPDGMDRTADYTSDCVADPKITPRIDYCPLSEGWSMEDGVCVPGACAQDTQECSDGSFVPRDPENNCEFKSCTKEQAELCGECYTKGISAGIPKYMCGEGVTCVDDTGDGKGYCSSPGQSCAEVCTADTQDCSDGSSVGRDPENNCEFRSCAVEPTDNPGEPTKVADSGGNPGDDDGSSTTPDDQPELPEELPQSGPEDWLSYIKAGLGAIGVGAILLLFL